MIYPKNSNIMIQTSPISIKSFVFIGILIGYQVIMGPTNGIYGIDQLNLEKKIQKHSINTQWKKTWIPQ